MVMVYKDQIDQVEVVMLPGSLNVRLHIDLKFFINTEFIIDEIHIYIYILYVLRVSCKLLSNFQFDNYSLNSRYKVVTM